jgi:hypothetical protein
MRTFYFLLLILVGDRLILPRQATLEGSCIAAEEMNETFLRACVRACVRTERHDTLARDAIKRCCNVADDYIVHYGIGSYDERPL